jgi:hypothetical protein
MTYDEDGEESEISAEMLLTILAEYRAWQGEIRSSHSLPVVVQLAHASDAHGFERGSQ